jgi:uncharacterized membrane protein YraQ (UPF0718 family)
MAKRGRVIDGTVILMGAMVVGLAILAYRQGGEDLLTQGLTGGGTLLLRYGLVLLLAFLAAGFAELLIPHEWVRETLGADSGWRGIAIAWGAGIITPAGPFVSMPIAAVMLRAGAAPGVVVVFLTAWALLALHRFVAWEIPILGWRVAALRYGACVLLPFVAGGIARMVSRG